MMDHKQLELDFEVTSSHEQRRGIVVPLALFADARKQRQQQCERAQLLAAIVRSVDHIRGSDPDAEAM